jgi:hypothetical protein
VNVNRTEERERETQRRGWWQTGLDREWEDLSIGWKECITARDWSTDRVGSGMGKGPRLDVMAVSPMLATDCYGSVFCRNKGLSVSFGASELFLYKYSTCHSAV